MRSLGFGLIEAIASTALIALGVVASLACLGAIAKAQDRSIRSEYQQTLALEKYDEMVSTGVLPNGSVSGDFADRGEPEYSWQAQRTSTGSGNLDSITVTVHRQGQEQNEASKVTGLVCRTVNANGGSK